MHYLVENPYPSDLWSFSEWIKVAALSDNKTFVVRDQCQDGLEADEETDGLFKLATLFYFDDLTRMQYVDNYILIVLLKVDTILAEHKYGHRPCAKR